METKNQKVSNVGQQLADMCKFSPVVSVAAIMLAILAIEFAPIMLILVVGVVTAVDIVFTFGSILSIPTMLFHAICAIGTAVFITCNDLWNGWTDSYVSEYDHQYYADEYTSTFWLVLYGVFALRCAVQIISTIVFYRRERKGA